MIHYKFYQKNPASHYIYIDLTINNIDTDKLQMQLPAWRPGRYELGNFAKNIKRVDAFDLAGKELRFTKLNKDLWEIETQGSKAIKVTYSYFAAELNAGACYADSRQIYVNPVHCCMYVPGRTEEQHVIQLEIPAEYRIVSSLKIKDKELFAADYEELVDSPFVASPDIQSDSYTVEGLTFFLHFIGICRPDFKQIKADFVKFTRTQISFWKDFPVPEYHFIFQILPVRFYHGVEHQRSTVIAIGPGHSINSGVTYEDILGVSSHELFHTWNVKKIRPAEMLPYDYTKENYARTGYVYEGFTTYYGDKLLLSGEVFTEKQYFKTLEERLLKHFHNYGRYNLSVTNSSYETWLDGYVPGAPYRKTNIYDEGNLVALMLDCRILSSTGNERSLRDVCRRLYEEFGKKGKGYTEEDIQRLASEVAGKDLREFFKDYVYSAADYEKPLMETFSYLGVEFRMEPSTSVCEHLFGFKVAELPPVTKIQLVAPYSPAWKAGLFAGDEIMAVNSVVTKGNINPWLQYYHEEEITLTVCSGERLKTVPLPLDRKRTGYFSLPSLTVIAEPSDDQRKAFKAWKNS